MKSVNVILKSQGVTEGSAEVVIKKTAPLGEAVE
jgi:hypothetical protein